MQNVEISDIVTATIAAKLTKLLSKANFSSSSLLSIVFDDDINEGGYPCALLFGENLSLFVPQKLCRSHRKRR